jgi:acyl carrier protein
MGWSAKMADKLIEIFAEGLNLPTASLNDDCSPDNTPEWDSLAAMNMVSLLEDTFNARLTTKEIMKMRSIGKAREVLRSKGVEGI